jgi:hypothetical protein
VGNNEAPPSAHASTRFRGGIDDTEFFRSPVDVGFIPITSACKFNIRQLDVARFTCVKEDDNMLVQLAKNQHAAYGDIVVVITSFQYDEDVAKESAEIAPQCRMYPSINQEESSTRNIHAVPLTTDILRRAIEFINGEEPAEAFSTVEGGLKIYLDRLKSLFLSDRSALDFIKKREWKGCNGDVPCDGADSKHVRRFLHQYLARETRIVAHSVDGIHRVTAFDCALLGLSNTTLEPGGLDVLGKKNINIIAFTPTAITEHFADAMKGKSNEIQRSLKQNLPHTLRDFLHQEMGNLNSNCAIPYLWDCLGALYKRLARPNLVAPNLHQDESISVDDWIPRDCNLYNGDVSEWINQQFTTGDITALQFTTIITRYIQSWVKHTAEKILHVLGKSKHHVFQGIQDREENTVDDATLTSDRRMFMRSINKKEGYTIFPCRLCETRLIHLLKDSSGIHSDKIRDAITSHPGFLKLFTPNRFGKRPHSDVIFMSCQILLWSRTSATAYENLIKVFSSFSPECREQKEHGNEEDAFRWITNFFHNVTNSAFHSFGAWKLASFKFLKNKGCVAANNPDEAVYLCLLGSAIATCMDFFWKLGLKPICKLGIKFPQQYTEDMASIYYLSALVINHSLRMDESEKRSNDADTQKIYRVRVNCNITQDNQTKNVLTPRRINVVPSYVIIGDPRHIFGDGSYRDFVQVLKASDPNQDLFTASIRQHEGYLSSGHDNLNNLGEVTLVDQERANDDSEMDEGGNSSQKDEDEDMNEDEGKDEDEDEDEDNNGGHDGGHEDNKDNQDNDGDMDDVGGGNDNREKGGGRGNQQGQRRGRGGRGNQQKKRRSDAQPQKDCACPRPTGKKKGHVGGSDEVTNPPTDSMDNDTGEAEEGEVEDRPSEEDTDAGEEQVGNQSRGILYPK